MAGRASLGRVGRETDLVVRDHVQGATGRVAFERVEVESLGDDPLAGESGIAVQKNGHRGRRIVGPVARGALGLDGAGHSLDDRVDRFEMARVGGQGDRDLPAVQSCSEAFCAEVILDVAGAALDVGVGSSLDRALTLELADDLLVREADRGRRTLSQPRGPCRSRPRGRRGRDGEKLERFVEHWDQHVEALRAGTASARGRSGGGSAQFLDLAEAPCQRRRCSSELSGVRKRHDSIALRSQTRCSWSPMCSSS